MFGDNNGDVVDGACLPCGQSMPLAQANVLACPDGQARPEALANVTDRPPRVQCLERKE